MPLVYKIDIGHGTTLGIWEFDYNGNDIERIAEDALPQSVCKSIKGRSHSRQEETIAVYSLLRAMTCNSNLIICHEASGRPFLTDTKNEYKQQPNIGISHTHGFASIIMSTEYCAAVDIEYISDRISNIATRFLRDDEKDSLGIRNDNLQKRGTEYAKTLLVYWCAKETIYKYYSNQRLTFENIKVEPHYTSPHTGTAVCTNIINGERKDVIYTITDKYVITYCL